MGVGKSCRGGTSLGEIIWGMVSRTPVATPSKKSAKTFWKPHKANHYFKETPK